MLSRRKLITGLISFAAAPAIVRSSSLMPVKTMAIFDPQEAFDRLISEYVPSGLSFVTPRLFWFNNAGKMVIMPIEESNLYLDSLND